MPIYEFECQKCRETFEVMQKMSDPPPSKHSCGSRRVKRVLSASAFVFKGEGWYVTDYARKDQALKEKRANGKEGGDGSDSKSESETKTKSETNSDSKPKAESKKTTAAKSDAA